MFNHIFVNSYYNYRDFGNIHIKGIFNIREHYKLNALITIVPLNIPGRPIGELCLGAIGNLSLE